MCYYIQVLTHVLKGLVLGVLFGLVSFLRFCVDVGFLSVWRRLLFVAHSSPGLASFWLVFAFGLVHLEKRIWMRWKNVEMWQSFQIETGISLGHTISCTESMERIFCCLEV